MRIYFDSFRQRSLTAFEPAVEQPRLAVPGAACQGCRHPVPPQSPPVEDR